MMENAGLSVETGPPEQLDQAYQLDFESNVELEEYEARALDFGLGGSYEEDGHIPTEQTPADAYAGFDDILTGHLPDDAAAETGPEHASSEDHPTAIDDEAARTTEATNVTDDADDDVKPDVEYQDEIGYEDDELLTTEANAELSNTDADGTEVALADTLTEGNSAPVPVTDDDDGGHLEESLHGNDASWDQDIDFQGHGESAEGQDQQHELDADAEETAGQQDGNGLAIDAFDDEGTREQLATDYRGFDLEKVLDDIANPHTEVPDIEVLYNQECYSLFGNLDDDPDSYFLSGVEELDRPLSHFLSALRAVISDEIATTDELLIRFDPLDLEFGERSSEKFLNRSFREILDCHFTLGQASGMPADPVLHLTVRRDSEEHFLQLLVNAARVNGSPSSEEDSEMSEKPKEGSPTNDLNFEQAQDAFEGGNSDQYHDEGGHIDADHEEKVEFELAPSHDDASGEQEEDDQFDAIAPQPSDTAGTSSGGEEHFETPSAKGLSHETMDDGVDEGQDWDDQTEGDGDGAVPQDTEILFEDTDEVNQQPTEQQGDEPPEASDGVAAPNHGAPELETGSNDDDLILAFDDEPGLSSIHEGADEREDIITYDDPANPDNDAEDTQEAPVAGTSTEYAVEHSENGGHNTAIAETASVHTSTTMTGDENGDEIDYDEDDTANDAFTPANDDAQQLVVEPEDGTDEIDWENDEDEYEQQPAIENAGADYEESKQAPPTPPSVAGKRSRADETESLADETDYKRRRT